MKFYPFILLLFIYNICFSQAVPKEVEILKINKSPVIDGVLDEAFWQDTDLAKDFVMFEPGDGGAERNNKKTTVRVAYDDEAIYFGATLYDDTPNKVPMEFGNRDQFGNTDFFLVSINPNNDGQNDTEFAVQSTGAQGDAKVANGDEDFTWNAVWYSKVKFNKDSWVVEIKIPYSALRFSTNVETWGINFFRRIHYINEKYVWNYIDKSKGEVTQYSGLLTGLKNIESPTRLSFSPYASVSLTTFDSSSEFDQSIGLDIKYGINESFTLDATLIPDFGQTAFDDLELNLGPFELQYDEQRAFFTEGTELFSKGNLFYSRRIGNHPVDRSSAENDLGLNEEVTDNPDKVNMLNAIKLSGRTKKGLGIGIFNAITEKTSATITNTETDEKRNVVTESLANYNVLVLDQQFNKNSSVTLVNTNVTRNGSFRDANVTGLLYDISDKENKYNIKGNFKMSNVKENGEITDGFSGFLELSKTYGNVQYSAGHYRNNDTYDIKDLGFINRNNRSSYFGEISYQIFEPSQHFNDYRISFESSVDYLNSPNSYVGNEFELDGFFITKNRFAFGGNMETNIGNQFDYFEPRVNGRYFKQKGILEFGGWVSTDYRKKFAYDIRLTYGKRYSSTENFISVNLSPRFRFTNKFQIIYDFEYAMLKNENGWVNQLDDASIIFGNRDVKTVTNSLSGKFSFTVKSSLSLSFRHYWSPVTYDSNFYALNNQGTLDANAYIASHNINYNIWNLDLNYSWEFAPGSQLVALYRNNIFNKDDLSDLNFGKNLDNLFDESIVNNFSLKFIYFLDYNKMKTWL
ncbi:carbohydrate binding family 9 domain-containing protein [Aureibaculum sp. A20]|uniref:Carbohydrate binding family 9 domain-containing protein n=1 Tax=Aureibaculum flavum TaxID=2795986 RepID=A0ABS0WRR2_9FLAO|nr:DUF5916 domain-containing protein [Aureibaculum flavum]MBJ2174558.1 carbohydrate binding family 9 domain-containing protein [Aureibaculum flavum]